MKAGFEATPQRQQSSSDDFAHPDKWCDIVMKGGITSGIVYPPAICQLAREYVFKNVGGTSAGAIAAAFTAAAEHGRDSGGFLRLDEVSRELEAPGKLFSLFQPQDGTRPLFGLLMRALDSAGRRRPSWWGLVRKGVFVAPMVWGMALLLALYWPAWRHLFVRVNFGVVALALFGSLLAVARLDELVRAATGEFQRNFFGICSGFSGDGSSPALTEWMAEKIDFVAGRKPSDGPLTFGDLWGLARDATRELRRQTGSALAVRRGAHMSQEPGPAEQEPPSDEEGVLHAVDESAIRINLEMITSNLGYGKPHRLPFETAEFFFHRAEMERLFPRRVVDWMVQTARPLSEREAARLQALGRSDYHHLPMPADLPVVVATRMSLSVPPLMSAIPLYAFDYRLEDPELKRIWFSDGGLCSNFPLYLFDTLLPRWPTFAINLRSPLPGSNDLRPYMITRPNRQGFLPDVTEIDSPVAYVVALLNTAKDWSDTSQSFIQGFKDRIVHIPLTAAEGGFNLDMPPATLQALAVRGQDAGACILKDFNWDSHRWIRYRVAMERIEDRLGEMAEVYSQPGPSPAGEAFEAFLGQASPSYYADISPRAAPRAEDLMRFVGAWRPARVFARGTPRPRCELRLTPHV